MTTPLSRDTASVGKMALNILSGMTPEMVLLLLLAGLVRQHLRQGSQGRGR